MWLFFITLNVSYEKWENQFSQVLPDFVSHPVSGDTRMEVSLRTLACDSSLASHTLGGKTCWPKDDYIARSPEDPPLRIWFTFTLGSSVCSFGNTMKLPVSLGSLPRSSQPWPPPSPLPRLAAFLLFLTLCPKLVSRCKKQACAHCSGEPLPGLGRGALQATGAVPVAVPLHLCGPLGLLPLYSSPLDAF